MSDFQLPHYSPRIWTAEDAIRRSVSHNEHVHLIYDSGLAIDLFAESDDEATVGPITEYWGTTDDGEEWRVSLHSGPQKEE